MPPRIRNAPGGSHPWFTGEKVEYLLVYRQVRRNKEDRWALCSGRIHAGELLDDLGLAERFGAGYFRVQARGAGGRILGAAYHVGIPDAEGRVPVPDAEGEREAPVVAQSADNGAVQAMLLEWLKLQQAQFREELTRVREDSALNLEAFAKINQSTIESLAAINGGRSEDRSHAQVVELVKRVEKIADENVKLRVELAEKSARRGRSEDGDFWADVGRVAVPKVLEILAQPPRRPARVGGADVVARVRAQTAPAAPAAAPAAAPEEVLSGEVDLTPEEYARRIGVLGWSLPPLDEVRAAFEANRISPRELDWFRVLADARLLPPEYRFVVSSA